jgi:hypothetical protein
MAAYAVAAIADEAAGAGQLAAALSALCDELAVSGEGLVLALPSAALSRRLPALVAAGGHDQGDVPLLAVRAIAEASEAALLRQRRRRGAPRQAARRPVHRPRRGRWFSAHFSPPRHCLVVKHKPRPPPAALKPPPVG